METEHYDVPVMKSWSVSIVPSLFLFINWAHNRWLSDNSKTDWSLSPPHHSCICSWIIIIISMEYNTDFIQQEKVLRLVLNDWFMVNPTVKRIWGLFTDRKYRKLFVNSA